MSSKQIQLEMWIGGTLFRLYLWFFTERASIWDCIPLGLGSYWMQQKCHTTIFIQYNSRCEFEAYGSLMWICSGLYYETALNWLVLWLLVQLYFGKLNQSNLLEIQKHVETTKNIWVSENREKKMAECLKLRPIRNFTHHTDCVSIFSLFQGISRPLPCLIQIQIHIWIRIHLEFLVFLFISQWHQCKFPALVISPYKIDAIFFPVIMTHL